MGEARFNVESGTLNMIFIQCYLVFNVTMETFWMALLMNEYTNIVMDDG